MIVTRRLVLSTAAAALGAGALGLSLGRWVVDAQATARQADTDAALPLPLGEVDVTLTDHRGRRVAVADWVGRPSLVFFGFTHCPEVCPTTLSDISLWLEELGPEADRLNVALVTVDPERDTVPALAEYLSYFDPRITGYSGTPEEIAAATAAFRVRYEKRPVGDDYAVDHTAGVFLFRADGAFGGIIDFHEDRAFALPKLRRLLA